MNTANVTRLRWAVPAAALAVAIGLSWCIYRSPLTLYDSAVEILAASQSPSAADTFVRSLHQQGYFRPLRLAQIKLAYDLSPARPVRTFKTIHVVLTVAACLLFVALLRPRTTTQVAAALVALMIFIGHHAFFNLVAEAYPINHFLEILCLVMLAALVAGGTRRWWTDAIGITALVVGLLALESGILVWVALVTVYALGGRGVSRWAVAASTVVLVAYFGLRFGVLHVTAPALDERSTGFLLERLDTPDIVARFGSNPLPFYAYNAAAQASTALFSEPRQGQFKFVRAWLHGELYPWNWIHLASSLVTTLVILVALLPAARRAIRREASAGERLLLLAPVMVAANAVLSFAYAKDEVMSVGTAFYAAGAYAALAVCGERVATGGRSVVRMVAAVTLVVISCLWATRAAGGLFSLRSMAYRTQRDWAFYDLEREMPRAQTTPATIELFERLRTDAVSRQVPHPHFTDEGRIQKFVEIQ